MGRDWSPLNAKGAFWPDRWFAAGVVGLFLLASGLSGARADADAVLSLPASQVILTAPDGWTIRSEEGGASLYPPEQPGPRQKRRIHFRLVPGEPPSLEEAALAEVERITQRGPKWGSSNDWRSFKGCVPVRTASGLSGLRAGFWEESPQGRRFAIVKYYFRDEKGRIFCVCAHIHGGETDFVLMESAILGGLGRVPSGNEGGR